jgi:hypothetical protein
VVHSATHSFDDAVMDVIVKRSTNPIEACERSSLIQASVIHGRPVAELVRPEALPRLLASSPALFAAIEAGPQTI